MVPIPIPMMCPAKHRLMMTDRTRHEKSKIFFPNPKPLFSFCPITLARPSAGLGMISMPTVSAGTDAGEYNGQKKDKYASKGRCDSGDHAVKNINKKTGHKAHDNLEQLINFKIFSQQKNLDHDQYCIENKGHVPDLDAIFVRYYKESR